MLVYRLYVQKHVHTAHATMAIHNQPQQQQGLKQYPVVISQFAIDCLPISHGHMQ